ncbi:hypothetical protein V6N13_019778 [Hibiscus sabdariffa]
MPVVHTPRSSSYIPLPIFSKPLAFLILNRHSLSDVSTSMSTKDVDPEVLPQGPITREKKEHELGDLSLARLKLGSLLERLEGSQTNTPEEDHAENGSDQTPNQRQNPRQGRVQQVDDNLTNIKVAIPSFQGRTYPDAYLAWESKGLKQGSRSVEDYFKEMEMAMMRASIEEDREATMAHFLNGLNTDIANVVELEHYVEKPAQQAPLQIRERVEASKPKPPAVDVGRGKQPMHSTQQEHESNLLVEEADDDDLEEPETGKIMELMVVKRSLNAQPVQNEQQRENIFHTRCNVLDKVCVVIIDSGSCTNVASSVMVDKLGLKTTKHPHPYKLQWLNDGGEFKVTRQVVVPFSIGKYKDEVLCDVVTMDATHLLLEQPWQYDKKAMHDGFTKRYSFMHAGKKITLAPLTPSQVSEDQASLKKSIEAAKSKKKMVVYASSKEIRKCLSSQQSVLILLFKDSCLLAELPADLHAPIVSLLQEFEDVFPEETPKGLPPLRGIEHQIDFIPGATIPNRPAY